MMASRVDLHTHSTFSDGVLSPTELIDLAYRRGVRIMALTDNDTIEGLPEAFAPSRSRNGPAYVERERLTPTQVVKIITAANGLPTLAHPRELDQLEEF